MFKVLLHPVFYQMMHCQNFVIRWSTFHHKSRSYVRSSFYISERFQIIVYVPASRLLHCLAIDLQINPEDFLEKHSGILGNELNNESALRLLHYPPINNVDPENKITRCGKHTDYGGLTLLFQVSTY